MDLGELAIRRTISLESLSGKIIAMDAFNVLYQFLASIRQEDGTPLMDSKGRITAHLSGLFYRTARLIENGIKPVYVFDGESPDFKKATKAKRESAKKEAEQKWKRALEEERFEDARTFAQATSKLTKEMIEEAKSLLLFMGIPYFDAPSEGEAQAAMFVKRGIAYAVASQDYDALLFGSPILLRNISITGKRKVPRQERYILVEPEEIHLNEIFSSLGIDREQLILMGILVGTDYNEGVKGVGPKTALKLVKEYKTLHSLKSYVKTKYNYEFEQELDVIVSFFLNPPYTEPKKKFEWGNLKIEDASKMLCDDHDFSSDRVEKTLSTIEHAFKEKGAQKKLDDWFR